MAANVRNHCSTFINLDNYNQNNQADNNQQNTLQHVSPTFLDLDRAAFLYVNRICPHRHALPLVADTVSHRCACPLCNLCHPQCVAGFVLTDSDGCYLHYRVVYCNRQPFCPQAVFLFSSSDSYMLTHRPSARYAACKQQGQSRDCHSQGEPAQTVLS